MLDDNDFIHAKFDNTEDHNGPFHLVLIVSTPRSGSTMLSSLLYENGIGLPHEYVQPYSYLQLISKRAQKDDGPPDFEKLADFLIRKRTRNGYLSINIHGHHYQNWIRLKPFLIDRSGCVPRACLHINRLSFIDQAVSYYIAHATGNWGNFSKNAGRPSIAMDIQKFDKLAERLLSLRAMADQIFMSERIGYLSSESICYEQALGWTIPVLERIFDRRFRGRPRTFRSNGEAKREVKKAVSRESELLKTLGLQGLVTGG